MTESGRERPGEPLPPKVGLMTKTLLDGEFLDRRENLLVFGNPGSGKTHLLCAIGQELIAARAAGLLHNIGAAGPGSAGRQARSETEPLLQTAGLLRRTDHRRSRLHEDAMMTAAAIDRLVHHHCVVLELNIPSYRVAQAKKAKGEKPT